MVFDPIPTHPRQSKLSKFFLYPLYLKVENEIEYHKDTLESPKEESIEEGKFKGRSIDEPVKEDVDVCEEKLPESESPDRISGSVSPEVVPEVPPEVVPEVVPKVVPGMIPEVIPEVVPENESVDFEEEPPGLGYLTLPTLLEEEIQMERHCPSFGNFFAGFISYSKKFSFLKFFHISKLPLLPSAMTNILTSILKNKIK